MPLGVATVMNRHGLPVRLATAWDASREPQQPTRAQDPSLVADLIVEIPVQDDDDLVLRLVDVQRWTT